MFCPNRRKFFPSTEDRARSQYTCMQRQVVTAPSWDQKDTNGSSNPWAQLTAFIFICHSHLVQKELKLYGPESEKKNEHSLISDTSSVNLNLFFT